MQLTPNATRVLSLLGLLERVRGVSDSSGRHLRYARFGRHRPHAHQARRCGATLGSAVSRRASRRPPARARARSSSSAANVRLELGSTVAGIATDGERVSLGLKRGAASMQDAADLLIGADGLRSRVRERLGLGESDSASFTGRVAFRATVNSKHVDSRWIEPEVCLRLGPNAHLVHYPLRGGSIVNVVAVIEAELAWRRQRSPLGRRGRSTGARSGLRPLVDIDAEPHRGCNELASLAAVRPPSARFLLARSRRAGRRRGAPDGSFPCARRGAGHRGRRRARARRRSCGRAFARASPHIPGTVWRARRACRSKRSDRAAFITSADAMALARDAAMRVLGPRRLSARYDWLYGA